MSNKRILLLLLLFILGCYTVFGIEDFTLLSIQSVNSMCQGSTILYTTVVQNTGTSFNQYTVNTVGDATSWATTVPLGFSLNPGASRIIYTYVTPGFGVNPGDYNLDVVVSGTQLSKKVDYTASVQNCYKIGVSSSEKSKEICPGGNTQYNFKISNLGEYKQSYVLSLEGSGAGYGTLSQNSLELDSKTDATVSVSVSAPPNKIGVFDISLVVKSQREIASDSVKLNVLSCFDYSLQIEKTLLNVCDHTTTIVPVSIVNSGSLSNIYDLSLKGPSWVGLDNNNILVGAGNQGKVNLIVSPDYGVSGNFDLIVESKSKNGEIVKSSDIKVNVKGCNSVNVNIVDDNIKMCGSLSNQYNVLIKNTGEVTNKFNLKTSGVDWVSLSKNLVELKGGEETNVILTIKPDKDVGSNIYDVKVEAINTEGSVKSDDTIKIEVVNMEKCYEPNLNIEKKNVEIVIGDSVTIPVLIENKGSNTADYNIGVSGDAVNFVQVNPASIVLEAGKSEIVYLYLAPSIQNRQGSYSLIVSVRYDSTTIIDSDTININVVEKQGVKITSEEEEKVEKKENGVFNLIWSYKWYILIALILVFVIVRVINTRGEEEYLDEIEELNKEKKVEKKEVKEKKKKEEKREEIIKEDIEEVRNYGFVKYIVGLIVLAALAYVVYRYNSYLGVYKWYILGAIALLIIVILIIRGFGGLTKFFEEDEEFEEEREEKKEEKKVEKKEVKEKKKKEEKREEIIKEDIEEVRNYGFVKYIVGLIVLAALAYVVYRYFWNYVFVYRWYLLVGLGLLFLIIFLLRIGVFRTINDFFKVEEEESKEDDLEERPIKRNGKKGR